MHLPAFVKSLCGLFRPAENHSSFKAIKFAIILVLLFNCFSFVEKPGDGLITLSKKNVPLQEIFVEIYRQSGYFFMCKDNLFDQAKNVDINVKNAKLQEVLDICFKNQPLEYSISDHVIVVSYKKDLSQLSQVGGKVTNEKGEPLEAAAIQIKGTRKGTQTNAQGIFELKTEKNDNIELVISFTGFVSKTITVRPGDYVNIQLSISTSPLDQIQVIAYGTTSKRLSTSDISSVPAETIAQQPVSNFLAALEGRVPGLVVTQNTGVPGGGFFVQINGQNSIASGNDPYYIVDGVPFTSNSIGDRTLTGVLSGGNPLNNLNPSDIERIDVLKDADATAIYGSRGANGVILITTKKGKAGKTNLDLSYSLGSGKVAKNMELLNTTQYLEMRHEAFNNDGMMPSGYDDDVVTWDTTRYTDWQKELIGGAAQQSNAQVTISGGSASTQFLLGGTYFRESTVFPGNFADQKISAHFNLNHVSTSDKFKLSISASFLNDNNNLPETDLTSAALTLPPDAPPLWDSLGNVNWGPGFFNNPIHYFLQTYSVNANTLISNAVISYRIAPSLQAKVSLGYTQTFMNETAKYPITSFHPLFNIKEGNSSFSSSSIKTWILEPQLTYSKTVGQKNNFEVLIGSTFQQDLRQGMSLVGNGYKSDALLGNIGAAQSITTNPLQTPYDLQYRYTAIFGRIHFDHAEKYILNLTGRRDGSSRFGPGKQFANFGAVGAGWIFSKESFFKDHIGFISFGKLTGTYGITGNDQIQDYQYLENWNPTTYSYLGGSGLYPSNLANANYGWETNTKWEAGIELGFLNDVILLSSRFYQNRSSNQLVGFALPSITGFSSVQANLPAVVQNTGWELVLNAAIIKKRSFTWSASINLTFPRNQLLSYPNIEGSPYAYVYEVGKSLYIKKLYHGEGVDPKTGTYIFQTLQGGQNTYNPSYPEDIQGLNQIAQTFYGGFANSFVLKNWKLDLFLQFAKQNGYNYLHNYFGAPGMYGNQPNVVLARWQNPGQATSIQHFTQDYGSNAYTAFSNAQNYADNTIGDASFIRLKNVSLSYQIPTGLSAKAHIQYARIFVQGQNLFTITHFAGLDPESQSNGNLPPLRMIVAGIQLTF